MPQIRAKGSIKNQERFSTVPGTAVSRSAFDMSYSHKTTIDSGFLYPIHVDEVLPGDTVHIQPAYFARMATPLRPFMDGIHFDTQWFYTPLRILWDNFVRQMGERPDPADHNDYTTPQMTAPVGGYLNGTLSDYLTLPTEIAGYTHSSLFHRNYNLVAREWFRDENLTDPPVVDTDDGPDDIADYVLLRRAKRKDYFTGALLTAQKGDPVAFPIAGNAPVIPIPLTTSAPTFHTATDATVRTLVNSGTGTDVILSGGAPGSGPSNLEWETTGLETDLTSSTFATINDMRVAISMQHILERDARGGTRYRESVLATFGVHTDDIRLLRPELLATGSVPVQVAPVAQTTPAGILTTRLGDLGAFATATGVGRGFMKTFTEHGIIMCIGSVRAELSYQQGLHRKFTRNSRYDYFDPMFQSIGEQAVLSREIYTDGTGDPDLDTGDFSIWGYQPRYEEYRHRESVITGQFRSNFSSSLDLWHLALDFGSRPVLNNAFIEENPPIDRVVILDTEPEFLLDCFFKIKHVRPIARFGTPGLTRF